MLQMDEGCLSTVLFAVLEQPERRQSFSCASMLAEVEATMENDDSEGDESWVEEGEEEEGEESAQESTDESTEESTDESMSSPPSGKWEECIGRDSGHGFSGLHRHWMRTDDMSGSLGLSSLLSLALSCHGMRDRVVQWATTRAHELATFITSDTRLEYARKRLPTLPPSPNGMSRLARLDQLIMDSLHAVKLYVYPAWRRYFSECEVWLHADRRRGFACVSSIGEPCSELGADWSWRLPSYLLSGAGVCQIRNDCWQHLSVCRTGA